MTALPNAWNVHTIRRRIVARLVRSMAGARVTDGGEPGTLVRCHECDGTALLHKLDRLPAAVPATEETREEPPRLTREISDKITRAFVLARIPSEMTRALIDSGVFRAPSPATEDADEPTEESR